jgi:predicted Zn-dependent peptidase
LPIDRDTSGRRWRPRLATAELSLVLALLAPPALEAQAGEAVRDTTLENGLHVIVLPSHRIPMATLEIVVRAGAFTQIQAHEAGLPHVLEHMLFRSHGASGFGPDASELDAAYNGTTSDERVTYYMSLPSENVERGLDLLGELVRDPNFDADELEPELAVVRGELQRNASDPFWILNNASNRALWGSAFGRKDTIGDALTISQVEPAGLRDHYRRYYVPNNAALIASGDVEPSDVFRWAARAFERWRRGEDPFAAFAPPRIEPLVADTAFVVDVSAADVTFMIKWHGPSVSSDAGGALAAERGLSYAAGAQLVDRAAPGGSIYVTTLRPRETFEIVNDAIEGLRAGRIPQNIVSDFARSFYLERLSADETGTSQADVLASSTIITGRPLTALEYAEAFRRVTGSDIRRVLRDYLENVQYAFLGSPEAVPGDFLRRY